MVMNSDSWRIGDVKITRIVELSAVRTPEFGYRNLSTDEIKQETWFLPTSPLQINLPENVSVRNTKGVQ